MVAGCLSCLPRSWRAGEVGFDILWRQAIGVELVEPGTLHQQTDRIVKYGLKVIGPHLRHQASERVDEPAIHAVQYLPVGAATRALSICRCIAELEFRVVFDRQPCRYRHRRLVRLAHHEPPPRLSDGPSWALFTPICNVLLQMEDYTLLSGTLALICGPSRSHGCHPEMWIPQGRSGSDRTTGLTSRRRIPPAQPRPVSWVGLQNVPSGKSSVATFDDLSVRSVCADGARVAKARAQSLRTSPRNIYSSDSWGERLIDRPE